MNMHFRDSFWEILRFGIVGLLATTIHYAFYLLLQQWINYNVAYTLGYGLSFIANFFLTAHFTFRTNATVARGIGFSGIHLFNYFFQMFLLNGCVMLGIGKSVAPVIVYAIVIPIQFVLVRYIFHHQIYSKMKQTSIKMASAIESVATDFMRFLYKNRVTITATFLIGLFAYMFFFTNLLLNHDSVGKDCATGATISSGRWGLELFARLCPPYMMPWFIGIVSLALLCIAATVVVDMVKIERGVSKMILAGIIVTFPSFIAMYAYIHTAIPYSFSFLLSVLAAKLLQRGALLDYCIGAILIIVSLCIYQGYVAVTMSLILILFIQELTIEKTERLKIVPVITKYFVVVMAMGIYFAITKVILYATDTQFNSYADGMLQQNDSMLNRLFNVYWHFALFMHKNNGLINTPLSQVLHVVLFVIAAIAIAKLYKRMEKRNFLLLAASIALLPFAINIYEILTPHGIYAMILSAFCTIYIVVSLLCRHAQSRIVLGVNVVFAGVLLNNIFIANKTSLKLYLSYQNAYSYYTAMVANIHQHPEFTEGTKIAIVGNPQVYVYDFPGFAEDCLYVGADLINRPARGQMIQTKLGFNAPFILDKTEQDKYKDNPIFKKMNIYPYNGSIRKIDGVLVVKLSN